MFFNLPTFVEVDGEIYDIDSDFKTALYIMQVYKDKDISAFHKHEFLLEQIYTYVDDKGEIVTKIPENIELATKKALEFLNRGKESRDTEDVDDSPPLMDYEKDAGLYFPAINKFRETDIRQLPYLHWYTFLDMFNELDKDSPFISVLRIRSKLSKRKELDEDEADFKRRNPHYFGLSVDKDIEDEFEANLNKEMVKKYGTDKVNFNSNKFSLSKEDMQLLATLQKK